MSTTGARGKSERRRHCQHDGAHLSFAARDADIESMMCSMNHADIETMMCSEKKMSKYFIARRNYWRVRNTGQERICASGAEWVGRDLRLRRGGGIWKGLRLQLGMELAPE